MRNRVVYRPYRIITYDVLRNCARTQFRNDRLLCDSIRIGENVPYRAFLRENEGQERARSIVPWTVNDALGNFR